MLKAKRPMLIFEAAGVHWGEIAHMLWDLGYSLYDCDLPSDKRLPLTQPAFNTLAKLPEQLRIAFDCAARKRVPSSQMQREPGVLGNGDMAGPPGDKAGRPDIAVVVYLLTLRCRCYRMPLPRSPAVL